MNAMRTRRWAVAVLLAVAAGMAGCRKKSGNTTFNSSNDDDIFTTDEFPGSSVQDGNVADDKRATSNSGEAVFGLTTVYNGDRGTAMLGYTTRGVEPGAPYHPYAQYFDGETWTPPVALQAPDIDLSLSAGVYTIAFINTETHASAAAQERNGDAIIFWEAKDVDNDGATLTDGVNTCLFATYFDVTHAQEPDHRFGFQELGTRLSTLDKLNENVGGFNLVTDGVCGELREADLRTVKYGQATTGIVAVWHQQEENDPFTPFTDDEALWYSWFDVATAGTPETPIVPTTAIRLPVIGWGASDVGSSSEETQVGQETIAYNNVLFFRVASRATAGSGLAGNDFPPKGLNVAYGGTMLANDDVTIQDISFDLATGTHTAPASLSLGSPDSTDTNESNMEFLNTNSTTGLSIFQPTADVYGPDEGLAQILIFYCELANDPDAVTDFGTGFQDGYLMARGIDPVTGGIQSGVFISTDDPTIFDTVIEGDVATRISRNGDYIMVAYLQPDAAGASDDLALRVAEIKTTRPAEDGSFTLPAVSLATSLTTTLSTDIDGYDVGWFKFQEGLGYVCGSQSDPDVMNIFWEHSNATSDQIFQARLTAGLTVPPTLGSTVSAFESFEDGDQGFGANINDSAVNFNAVDSGEGGNVFAVFRQDVDATATDDFRLFARRTGLGSGKVEIDSASSARQARSGVLTMVVTPRGESIGTYDPLTMVDSPDRPHPAGIVHVLFSEDRYVTGSGTGPAMRARAFHTEDTSIPFGDSLSPGCGAVFAAPFDLELPFVDPDAVDSPKFASGGSIRVDATTVGVWFGELGHIYYQEYNEGSDAWLTLDGVSNPILVDDDSPIEVLTNGFVMSRTSCACDNLHGAMVFWLKQLDPGSGDSRLQVRVRE